MSNRSNKKPPTHHRLDNEIRKAYNISSKTSIKIANRMVNWVTDEIKKGNNIASVSKEPDGRIKINMLNIRKRNQK